VKTPGFRTGGVGVVRLSAAANHSSEKPRMREPNGLLIKSTVVSKCPPVGSFSHTNVLPEDGLDIFWSNWLDRVLYILHMLRCHDTLHAEWVDFHSLL